MRPLSFFTAFCLYVFLLETQKGPKLPRARETRPRGRNTSSVALWWFSICLHSIFPSVLLSSHLHAPLAFHGEAAPAPHCRYDEKQNLIFPVRALISGFHRNNHTRWLSCQDLQTHVVLVHWRLPAYNPVPRMVAPANIQVHIHHPVRSYLYVYSVLILCYQSQCYFLFYRLRNTLLH